MVLAKILGVVGRTLISAGLIIFLFVGYQLWGTGWQEARSQDELEDDFAALLADATPEGLPAVASTSSPTTPSPVATTVPTDSDDPAPAATAPAGDDGLVEIVEPRPGEAMAKIIIDTARTNPGDRPHMRVDKVVVASTSLDVLKKAPGHYTASSYPGTDGNSAIAGHRTTYGQPFHNIDHLLPGDLITVQTVQGLFQYEVMTAEEAFTIPDGEPATVAEGDDGNQVPAPENPDALVESAFDSTDPVISAGADFERLRGLQEASPASYLHGPEGAAAIVAPDGVWVLGDYGDDRLTLTACHPKYTARQRIVVAARLVGEPIAPPVLLPNPEATAEDVDIDEVAADAPLTEDPTISVPGDDEVGTVLDVSTTDPTSEADAAGLDLETGLGGDQSARNPALIWFLAAMAIWFLAWLAARRISHLIVVPAAAGLLTVVALALWPSDVVAALPLALGGVGLWLLLWLATRTFMEWLPYLQVACLTLFGLAPCFYYVDRWLPA